MSQENVEGFYLNTLARKAVLEVGVGLHLKLISSQMELFCALSCIYIYKHVSILKF